MNCQEARQHWDLYHDSEGDAELHFQVNAHLESCPDCARWFYQQSMLETTLAARLTAGQGPTKELWQGLLEKCRESERAGARRWVFFGGPTVALVLLALGALWYWWPAPDLAELTADHHRRLVAGELAVPFRSDSDSEVERYLRQHVSFPVRCPPRGDAGFQVQGTGVCRLAGNPAAFLAGRVNGAPVSVFVLARDSLPDFPAQSTALRGQEHYRCQQGRYRLVMAQIDQNLVLVVGEVDVQRLTDVLDAYGSYPDSHHG